MSTAEIEGAYFREGRVRIHSYWKKSLRYVMLHGCSTPRGTWVGVGGYAPSRTEHEGEGNLWFKK